MPEYTVQTFINDRTQRGLSQWQWAYALNVTERHVFNIESGRQPLTGTLLILCRMIHRHGLPEHVWPEVVSYPLRPVRKPRGRIML